MMSRRATPAAMLTALLVLLWLAMMLTGTGPPDQSLLAALYAADRPALRSAAIFVTVFGNWQAVILLSIIGLVWLIYRGRRESALMLISVTMLGRVLVEAQKVGIHRMRPEEHQHLVAVKSLSFPSAHAANSMMLFLSLALIAAPREHRRWAVPLALACTFVVGISRPMLGVHWPSDVVGGWAFGAAWVLIMLWAARRAGFAAHQEGRAQ